MYREQTKREEDCEHSVLTKIASTRREESPATVEDEGGGDEGKEQEGMLDEMFNSPRDQPVSHTGTRWNSRCVMHVVE